MTNRRRREPERGGAKAHLYTTRMWYVWACRRRFVPLDKKRMGNDQQKRTPPMVIYHCSIKIISHGKGKSVVTAAYRAERNSPTTLTGKPTTTPARKALFIRRFYSPATPPPLFLTGRFRATWWRKSKKRKTPGLQKNGNCLPHELTREQGITLVREYVKSQFVNAGICADFAIHNTDGGNPHAHERRRRTGTNWPEAQTNLSDRLKTE